MHKVLIVDDDRDLLAGVPLIVQTSSPREIGLKIDAGDLKIDTGDLRIDTGDLRIDADDSGRGDWMKLDEILTKPVPLDILLQKIEKYLER